MSQKICVKKHPADAELVLCLPLTAGVKIDEFNCVQRRTFEGQIVPEVRNLVIVSIILKVFTCVLLQNRYCLVHELCRLPHFLDKAIVVVLVIDTLRSYFLTFADEAIFEERVEDHD